jgi:hypothetical protein
VALLDKIKAQIGCFNSPSDVQRHEELMRLKDYLNYRICIREYEAKVAAAHGNVAGLRGQYVKAILDAFDDAERTRIEQEKWGWSPLYRIFKEWPLPNFQKSPWAHVSPIWYPHVFLNTKGSQKLNVNSCSIIQKYKNMLCVSY